MPSGTKIFTAGKVFTGEEWKTDMCIQVRDGIITGILPSADTEEAAYCGEVLVPAFIDVQLYGAYGRLLAVYPDEETLSLINRYCLEGGAVLFLPTVATNTVETFHQCIDAVRAYWDRGGVGVHGLHLEGPWLNKEKRGAHVSSLIHPPVPDEVKELLDYGKGVIKMITLAPEVCSREILEVINNEGIVISAGHSNAGFAEAMESFDRGVSTVTHLFNAMSPLHHREPGLVGAVLSSKKIMASIIPDGHHVDYAAIRIAKQMMGERLFAITDAVTETSEGFYRHQLAGDKYECNGVLSGSALNMFGCFANLVKHAGIETGEALRMCSLYPARVIRQDHLYGKIAPGYKAQFVVMNKQLEMMSVITL